MQSGDILRDIRPVLARILRVEEDAVQLGALLSDDLGAESIDLAEIQIVLEEAYGIKAAEEYIAAYLMGGLVPSEFYDSERNVTPEGLQRLTDVVSGFDASKWPEGELNMYNLWRVLTVDALCAYVCHALLNPPVEPSR